MLSSLKLNRDILVMESLSLTSIKETAYRLIPNVIREMRGFISTVSPTESAITLSSKHKEFLNDLRGHHYLDLALLNVYVPEGMSTSYKRYCEALESAIQYAENLPTELSNYSTFISRILNNVDDLKSTDYAKFKYDSLNNELDVSIIETSKCFKKNNTDTEAKYGNVVQNNTEWRDVLTKINNFVTRIEAIKRTDLIKQLEDVTKLLDMLQAKIKRQEIDNISPEMAAKVGDYTYIIARYFEYYSVTFYRIKALAESINETINKVDSIMNRK